jgi:hypothetical protein
MNETVNRLSPFPFESVEHAIGRNRDVLGVSCRSGHRHIPLRTLR